MEIGPRGQLDETGEIAIGGSGDRRPVVIADLHVEAARGALRPAPDVSKPENPQDACQGRGIDPPVLTSPGAHEAVGLPGAASWPSAASSRSRRPRGRSRWGSGRPRCRGAGRRPDRPPHSRRCRRTISRCGSKAISSPLKPPRPLVNTALTVSPAAHGVYPVGILLPSRTVYPAAVSAARRSGVTPTRARTR